MYTILQNKRRRWLGVAPTDNFSPTNYISLEREFTANRIHFKYLKNILISRFYEQFS